ncbi:methylated-DNA--[protein]-cysteine S-methyltransferase [Omnitrophica bacterium]|nr:methylated-DNA--[protein]-cysteine S-methyltransferase [Candidatus Omnitrophota bacterium]
MVSLAYGIHPSPFGPCFLVLENSRIVWLSFLPRPSALRQIFGRLKKEYPGAFFSQAPCRTERMIKRIFGRPTENPKRVSPRGTVFQKQVWKSLQTIPFGRTCSYQELARRIGRPKAVRAVAGAVAENPIAYAIPCHRVIHKDGNVCGYRWGTSMKKTILSWEASRC